MPTGYTCGIQEGKIDNAKDFLILCARNFGATVTMRDEPLDTPIPEFKPSNTYLEWIDREKEKLEKYKSMTIEEAQKEINETIKNNIKSCKEGINKNNDIKRKYIKVLNEVKQWQPPTKEHINLKNFAIKQLEESIKWDCSTEYIEEELENLEKRNPDAETWLMDRIKYCIENIEKYKENYAEEVKRIDERNKWVNDLKESLE